jgi:hypothetical protein
MVESLQIAMQNQRVERRMLLMVAMTLLLAAACGSGTAGTTTGSGGCTHWAAAAYPASDAAKIRSICGTLATMGVVGVVSKSVSDAGPSACQPRPIAVIESPPNEALTSGYFRVLLLPTNDEAVRCSNIWDRWNQRYQNVATRRWQATGTYPASTSTQAANDACAVFYLAASSQPPLAPTEDNLPRPSATDDSNTFGFDIC